MILLHARELNAFAVGEENARHVGVNVRQVKLIILIAVSGLIGVCVSIGGTIGFVGLTFPHITRSIVGTKHKRLVPASMLVGGSFLVIADILSRILVAPEELPIGVVSAFFGAPFFLYLIRKSHGKEGGGK